MNKSPTTLTSSEWDAFSSYPSSNGLETIGAGGGGGVGSFGLDFGFGVEDDVATEAETGLNETFKVDMPAASSSSALIGMGLAALDRVGRTGTSSPESLSASGLDRKSTVRVSELVRVPLK